MRFSLRTETRTTASHPLCTCAYRTGAGAAPAAPVTATGGGRCDVRYGLNRRHALMAAMTSSGTSKLA